MALINSAEYSGLGSYGIQNSGPKAPGKFKIIYISGKKRPKEEVGKIQVVDKFNEGQPEFILNNVDSLRFVLLFIKRVRQLVQKVNDKEKTICFNYNDEDGAISSSGRMCPPGPERKNGFCNNCKFHYIFAGIGLDASNKPITYEKEDGNSENLLFYIKNQGMKFTAALDLLDEIAKKNEELEPLSDNMEYEKNAIAPRRFIIEAKPGSRESKQWGDIPVFDYSIIAKLPNDQVLKILEQSKKLKDNFDNQFDISKYLAKSTNQSSNFTSDEGFVGFEDNKPSKENEEAKPNIKQVDAAELSGEIDLGF